ncbi:MAG: pyridoxal-phosphate dependent enzyme [Spirochaetota bacterium]
MINVNIDEKQLEKNARLCKAQGIILPTFEQMKNPGLIPAGIKKELEQIGLWDVHSRNLFRVTWQNEPEKQGGGFGEVNYLELPARLTGVKARIAGLVGKWFPTGAHKVGASYGCIVPALVTGQFNPEKHKAVWPSTGNYCRGGAYISRLLGCNSIAILPEGMSRERFEWLSRIAGEIIATPGCESNVKEIFDKCRELKATRGSDIFIFNQFEEFGNYLWHHEVTGKAMEKVLNKLMGARDRMAGICLSSGSAGTLGSGDYLKEIFPRARLAVGEALQCPTLLSSGFGGHRIEGIGDKHIPWIHNVKNTDLVIAVDDEHALRSLRLFNEEIGRDYLAEQGVDKSLLDQLDLLGISSIGNLVAAIKFAKYYELTENDIVLTVFTDSFELYASRIEELTEERGPYTRDDAVKDFEMIKQLTIDHVLELSYTERKRIHNLKYYTWVEQQGKTYEEINAQWYEPDYWTSIYRQAPQIDGLIREFNARINAL